MRLSEQGRALLPRVTELLAQADRLRAEAAGSRRPIRFGTLDSLAATRLPAVLARLDDSLDVHLHSQIRPELLAGLARGDLDAALLLDVGPTLGGLGFASPTELTFLDVGAERLHLVAVPDHPLVGAGPVEPERLAEHRILVGEPGCSFYLAVSRMLAHATNQVRMRSLSTIRSWACAGLGLALLPDFAVRADLDAGRLAAVRVAGVDPVLALRLVWRADRDADPDLRALLYALAA